MGKKRTTRKKKPAGPRMAKMVTRNTCDLINQLSEAIRKERRMESRVSDNDTIHTAVREALDSRGLR